MRETMPHLPETRIEVRAAFRNEVTIVGGGICLSVSVHPLMASSAAETLERMAKQLRDVAALLDNTSVPL